MQIFDLDQKEIVEEDMDTFDEPVLGGCHLLDDHFAMASSKELHFWTFDQTNSSLVMWTNHKVLLNASKPAVCVRLSAKAEFCAVGFRDGLIQLFRLDRNRPRLVHQLVSHTTHIHALLFSPWASDARQPIILASVSEQLCFWNITFAINNPTVDDHIDGFSQRFFGRVPVQPALEYHRKSTNDGPWTGKLGPNSKQELLACYKFNGKAAKQLFTNADFTRFLTIDDVGEIYFFKVPSAAGDKATNGDLGTDSGIDDVIQYDS